YCFVFALGYLTVCQISRVYIFDYGQYSADFSGPMMIITQKITSLAYEVHDGMFRKEEELTPSQRCLAVRRKQLVSRNPKPVQLIQGQDGKANAVPIPVSFWELKSQV
ncbi:hypothetical protein lerEdw1_007508, partial [Lerista edwardsae]